MRLVGRWRVEFAECFLEALAVVAELVEDVPYFVDDPDMTLRVVRTDLDLVLPARGVRQFQFTARGYEDAVWRFGENAGL